jgi:hypothetical protein
MKSLALVLVLALAIVVVGTTFQEAAGRPAHHSQVIAIGTDPVPPFPPPPKPKPPKQVMVAIGPEPVPWTDPSNWWGGWWQYLCDRAAKEIST